VINKGGRRNEKCPQESCGKEKVKQEKPKTNIINLKKSIYGKQSEK
jgi:hypothetical protein